MIIAIQRKAGGALRTLFLLTSCGCLQCKSPGATDAPQASAAPSAVPSAPAPAASAAPSAQAAASACAGKYKGKYVASARTAGLSRKEGAPEKWETDDGHGLAGDGDLAFEVDAQNVISGTAKGALGEQTLRGICDGNTLRIQLDSQDVAPERICNAYLIAELTGNKGEGALSAATGDSLIRRTGKVTFERAE